MLEKSASDIERCTPVIPVAQTLRIA